MPNADIIADRFHVMKIVNQELNVVRNSGIKAVNENENEAELARILPALKQSKYALLKQKQSLTERQKIKLEMVKEVAPLLADMHDKKEAFRDIFETAKNWKDGTLKLLDWLAQNQENFPKSVATICRWFGEVVGRAISF